MSSLTGLALEFDADRNGVTIHHRYAIAVRADFRVQRTESVAREIAEDLLRLLLHLFFFAADERNHVGIDVHGSHARITRARNGLHGGSDHARDAELLQRRQRHGEHDRGAVRIGDDLPLPAALALLVRNDLQMIGIDFRNQQRNIRLHAMVARIGDDDVAGLAQSPARSRWQPRRPSRRTPDAGHSPVCILGPSGPSTLAGIAPSKRQLVASR